MVGFGYILKEEPRGFTDGLELKWFQSFDQNNWKDGVAVNWNGEDHGNKFLTH